MRDVHSDLGTRLVRCVTDGKLLDLAGDEPVDEPAMRSWGASRTVDAGLIREILRGRLASDPDPRGLALRGARIAGRLDLANLTTGVLLQLRDCFLPEGIEAAGASLPGLVLAGCLIEHPVEPPLAGDGLRVAGNIVLTGSVVAAHSEAGAVRLPGARVGGQLNCRNAKIHNSAGPALDGESLQVDGHVLLSYGFAAVGAGEDGAVRLRGAHIAGQLDCTAGTIHNPSGFALNAYNLRVDQAVFFWHGFVAIGATGRGTLRLRDARIGGLLALEPDGIENPSHPYARMNIDGLTYSGIPLGLSVDGWLALLREGPRTYTAQPYQQLAAVHRAAGHDREVRRILMEQRRHQISSKALAGPGARTWARLTGLTLGYGYQPWRALIGLFAVLMVAVALCLSTGSALAHTRNSSSPGTACTTVERVGVGLDLSLPLIKTGARTQCDLTDRPAGQRLAVSGWGLQLLAWAFATLFVAGFTGVIRKT